MLAILQIILGADNTITCFKPTQKLIGSSSLLTYTLILEPEVPLSVVCSAFSTGTSYTELAFATNAYKPTSAVAQLNMSAPEIQIVFQISTPALFTQLLDETDIQFTINFFGKLGVTGVIKTIGTTSLDSTNCWSNVIFNYDFKAASAFYELAVTPLNCKISPAVTAALEYEVSANNWKAIIIPPDPASGPNGFISDIAYDYATVTSFKQLAATITPSNFLLLKELISLYTTNRNIKMRLSITTQMSGIPQKFYAAVNSLHGAGSECFTGFQVYLGKENISVSLSKAQAGCSFPGGVITSFTILLKETTVYQDQVSFAFGVTETAKAISYPLKEKWPINDSTMTYSFFVSIFDASQNFVADLSYVGIVKKTCIESGITTLKYDGICMHLVLNPSARCYNQYKTDKNGALSVFVEQNSADVSQRISYFEMKFTQPAVKSAQIILDFCISQSDEIAPLGQKAPGSFRTRAVKYVQEKYNREAKQIQVLYTNDNENTLIQDIGIGNSSDTFKWVILAGAIGVATAGTVLAIFLCQMREK
ncbi:Conserved_hypothetical protein [Hexamita inflata]|uniref:Uncharacterized protein n=1 Tax=Hexamita inflata TaxID=28002 RepID=A0AA86PV43_9EUKA|nr:Conserved hypothetical protein [Hexamita inflata]